jgi:hypothetical protein
VPASSPSPTSPARDVTKHAERPGYESTCCQTDIAFSTNGGPIDNPQYAFVASELDRVKKQKIHHCSGTINLETKVERLEKEWKIANNKLSEEGKRIKEYRWKVNGLQQDLNVKKMECEDLEDIVKGKEFEVKDAEKKLEMVLSAATGSLDAPSSIADATRLEKMSFSAGAGGVCIILQVLSFTNGFFNQIKEEVVHVDELQSLNKLENHARATAGSTFLDKSNNFVPAFESLPRSIPPTFQRIDGNSYKVWMAEAEKLPHAPIIKAHFYHWKDYKSALKVLETFDMKSLGQQKGGQVGSTKEK